MSLPAVPVRSTVSRYQRLNLHGQIVHAIGRKILRGDLQPGDPIPVQKELPASRTAIREAIKVLAAKGLVEARPKIGTRVRPREAWNLLDPDVLAWRQEGAPPTRFVRSVTEVRSIIEPAAAGLAAARANAADVAAIERAYRDMEAAAAAPDGGPMNVADYIEADTRFHTTILQAAGNDILEQLGHVVSVALRASFEVTSRIPGSAPDTLPRHRAVVDAIRARRPKAAMTAMRTLVRSVERMLDEIPERGPRAAANANATGNATAGAQGHARAETEAGTVANTTRRRGARTAPAGSQPATKRR